MLIKSKLCVVNQLSLYLSHRYPPVSLLCKRMEETGFKVQSVLAHCQESIITMETYKDIQGPFDENWRNTTRYVRVLALGNVCED